MDRVVTGVGVQKHRTNIWKVVFETEKFFPIQPPAVAVGNTTNKQ